MDEYGGSGKNDNHSESSISMSKTNLDDTGSFKPRYINHVCRSRNRSRSRSKNIYSATWTAFVPAYAHHPLALAQQALAIDDIAPGRFRLGIGPSHRPPVEGIYGLSQATPLSYMREYLQVLRAILWDGKVSSSSSRGNRRRTWLLLS